jgi:plastocyanin
MRSSLQFAALALAVAVMTSCGGGSYSAPSSTTPANTTPNTATVSIIGSAGNQSFTPNPVMVSQGGTVTFKNNDSVTHHLVMDDGSADIGEITPGASKSATLKGASSNFHCVIHTSMVGSINGSTAPTTPEPCDPYYGYGGC